MTPRGKAYLSEHPVVFWFSVGIMLAGIVAILFPDVASKSSAAVVLPRWEQTAFNVTYAVGGFMGAWGIARYQHKLEAAGMALLASGLATTFVVFIYATDAKAPGAVFLLTLSIGCGQRCIHLARRPERRDEHRHRVRRTP